MCLIDTCVLSDLSPERSRQENEIADWLRRNERHCYLSAVTRTELAYGIAWLRNRRATAKAARLEAWYNDMVQLHSSRIIPVDVAIAHRAGALLARSRATGFDPDAEDAWIAATADLRGMTVLTFNEADFRLMGIACINPRTELPPDSA